MYVLKRAKYSEIEVFMGFGSAEETEYIYTNSLTKFLKAGWELVVEWR